VGRRLHPAMLLMPLVVGAVIAPMVVTSRTYAADWSNHLWLVWEQSLNIKELGHPSYFLQSRFGAFYPWFAFNGGTLYAVTGAVAGLLGEHPLAAYVGAYLMSIIAAYGGWLWLCRQLGLTSWRAHVPAILFVTSSYYVTNIYGRGDLPEVVGTSAIPLLVAAALYLLRAGPWRPLALVAFIAPAVFLTGSHTITVLWGVTFIAIAALVALLVMRGSWRPRGRPALSVLAVGVGALAVNAWYLLPAATYGSRILINKELPGISQKWYSVPGQLFAIFRDAPNPAWIHSDIEPQIPTLAVVWALVVAAVVWRRTTPLMRRMLLGMIALLALFAWLALSPGLVSDLGPWQHVEFTYRIVTYASLAACAVVMVVLLMLDHKPRATRNAAHAALALVTVFSVALAIQQVWHAPSSLPGGRNKVFKSAVTPPSTWYYGPDYADRSRPVRPPTLHSIVGGTPLATHARIRLRASPYQKYYSYPIVVSQPGTVATNVATGPYLVKVTGAKPVGRTIVGAMVLRPSGARGQRRVISFTTAASPPLRIGVALTLASVAGLLVLLVTVRMRRGRAERASPAGRAA